MNCIHCISRDTRKSVHRLPSEIKERIQGWCRRGLIQRIATDYSGDILWADARFGGELDVLTGLGVPFHIDNGSHLTEAPRPAPTLPQSWHGEQADRSCPFG